MDVEQIRGLKKPLAEFLKEFDDCFAYRKTRIHLKHYMEGQLSDLERKSVEPMALAADIPVRTLQEFLCLHRWKEGTMRDRLQKMVARDHAVPHSIGIIDETSFQKKGKQTPGVQRQYCGAVGKQDNCIVTVHLSYAADDFHCLLDGELFLPESWSNDRDRCDKAGIPKEMVYRPKHDIALELYDRATANGVTFEWLTFDEWYGAKPSFLRGLTERGQKFVGEVPKNFSGWLTPPAVTMRPYSAVGGGRPKNTPRIVSGSSKTHTVGNLLKYSPILRDQLWVKYRVKDGTQGPMIWEVKHARIHVKDEDGLPTRVYRLVVARNVLNPDEIKYFISNAPAEVPLGALLKVAFTRWRVERCFEDDKGEIGMDHYEGRKYVGLIRHLIISAASLLFLARMRESLKKRFRE
jgi:SRSO17 transposase